jgi:hypothetical protein
MTIRGSAAAGGDGADGAADDRVDAGVDLLSTAPLSTYTYRRADLFSHITDGFFRTADSQHRGRGVAASAVVAPLSRVPDAARRSASDDAAMRLLESLLAERSPVLQTSPSPPQPQPQPQPPQPLQPPQQSQLGVALTTAPVISTTPSVATSTANGDHYTVGLRHASVADAAAAVATPPAPAPAAALAVPAMSPMLVATPAVDASSAVAVFASLPRAEYTLPVSVLLVHKSDRRRVRLYTASRQELLTVAMSSVLVGVVTRGVIVREIMLRVGSELGPVIVTDADVQCVLALASSAAGRGWLHGEAIAAVVSVDINDRDLTLDEMSLDESVVVAVDERRVAHVSGADTRLLSMCTC